MTTKDKLLTACAVICAAGVTLMLVAAGTADAGGELGTVAVTALIGAAAMLLGGALFRLVDRRVPDAPRVPAQKKNGRRWKCVRVDGAEGRA